MSYKEWRVALLGDVASIQTGPFGSQLHASDYVDEGIPSIMPQNIGDNRVNETGIARIKYKDARRLSKYLVHQGDIVYSRRGNVEKRALIREREDGWLCGTGCLRVRVDKNTICPHFVAYYLGLPQIRAWVVQHAHGATMPNLNMAILSRLPLSYPGYNEQRAIAATLSCLDDKIELNNRMNKTFEEMAQAIFKSWFVDFKPFQDGEFEDSELGPIPTGWRVASLDSIAHFLNGLAMQKYRPTSEESLPVIKIRELNDGAVGPSSDRARGDLPSQYIIDDGDVIFSWSGTLLVKIWAGGKGALNQHLFKVTSESYDTWFYYLWLLRHLEGFRATAQDKATTMGHIKREHLTQAKVLIPHGKDYERVGSILDPILELGTRKRLESKALTSIRDTLLPKLMSGEIRVPEAERLLEEAL